MLHRFKLYFVNANWDTCTIYLGVNWEYFIILSNFIFNREYVNSLIFWGYFEHSAVLAFVAVPFYYLSVYCTVLN